MEQSEHDFSSAGHRWYHDHDVREDVRTVLRKLLEEVKTSKTSKVDSPQERRVANLQRDSALRLLGVLREKNVRKALGHIDVAAGSEALRRIIRAMGIREKAASVLTPPSGQGFVREYLKDQGMLPFSRIPGDHALLERLLSKRAHFVELSADVFDVLFRLHEDIAEQEEDIASSIYFLYLLLHDLQQTREVATIQTVSGEKEAGWFFRHMIDTVVYLERIIHLKARRVHQGELDEVALENASQDLDLTLGEIMSAPRLAVRQADLLAAAKEWFGRMNVNNQLAKYQTTHGPYDHQKIFDLLTCKLPPSLLANASERMDTMEEYCRLRTRAGQVLAAWQQTRDPQDGSLRSVSEPFFDLLHSSLTPICLSVVGELRRQFPKGEPFSAAKATALRLWLAQDQTMVLEYQARNLPDADPSLELGVLFGALHPQRIVQEPVAQAAFLGLYHHANTLKPSNAQAVDAQLSLILHSGDPFLYLPLEARDYPQYKGHSLVELLQEYVGLIRPEVWHKIVPSQTLENLALGSVTEVENTSSNAVAPAFDRKDHLAITDKWRKIHQSERFRHAWELLRRELRDYLGGDESHVVMPHLGGTQMFGHIIDALGKNNGEILMSSREYFSMVDGRIGDGEGKLHPQYFLRHDDEGRPLTPETLLHQLTQPMAGSSQPRLNPRTRLLLVSIVSRFGDVLFGASKTHPAHGLMHFLALLRESYPDLVVVLDASQAVARIPLPSLRDLDPKTILLGTGGKMLGVSQCGFAGMHREMASAIQGHHKLENDLPSDTLHTASILSLFLRLRELRGIHALPDLLYTNAMRTITKPVRHQALPSKDHGVSRKNGLLPVGERIMQRLNCLTKQAFVCAANYGSDLQNRARHMKAFEGMSKADRKALLMCHVFGPCKQTTYAGIVTLHFPSFPAPILLEKIQAKGFHASNICLDGTAIRFAFNEFQDEKDVLAHFDVIEQLHSEYLESLAEPPQLLPTPESVERARAGY